jgi:hypothetical protein
MTREEWLIKATERVRVHGASAGVVVPKNVRVSIGFPSSRARGSKSGRVIGQCFHPPASADGFFEVFISPVHEDSASVLSTLVHELAHAAVSPARGHGSAFRKAAINLDLIGPWTSAGFPTINGAPGLPAWAEDILADLGPIPHAALDPGQLAKKQGTRMLRLTCPGCGYIVRTTARWIAVGVPSCVCGELFEVDGPRNPVTVKLPAGITMGPTVYTPMPAPAPVQVPDPIAALIPAEVKGAWILEDILGSGRIAKRPEQAGDIIETFATPLQVARLRYENRPKRLDPRRLPK